MFKSILPVRRIPSSDFTMVTPLSDQQVMANGKENHPALTASTAQHKAVKQVLTSVKGLPQPIEERKKQLEGKKMKEQPLEAVGTNQAFNKLLDDLQIPSTLRPKLAGMDSTIKAAMVKSSQAYATNPKLHLVSPSTPGLRKARSTESLNSSHGLNVSGGAFDFTEPPFHASTRRNTAVSESPRVSAHHPSSVTCTRSPQQPNAHGRGVSVDEPRSFSRSQVQLPQSTSSSDLPGLTQPKHGKEKNAAYSKSISPTKFVSILSGTSSLELGVELIKKLRLLLRNESAVWSQDFLRQGGYSSLLTRLNEVLEVEWREEQHDDQILHELLRCLKALSTSSIGCFALRSSCPTPFVQLISLLYSDKKPGDVTTRQMIIELLLILFDLYPPKVLSLSGYSGNLHSGYLHRLQDDKDESNSTITLPAPHKTFYAFIRALLLTPAPPPSESPAAPVSPHAFIESLHRPRIYRTYLQELSDVCRDYFWVFCHPNNTIWILSETDEGRVEKPRAPGGMTGGVEFEAMSYFTTHLRLINAISRCVAELNMPREHEHSAHRFHYDLFLSGFERIILISRKASTTYYPTLHLELSRYIDHALLAGYELPYTVSRLLGPPPPTLAKNSAAAGSAGLSQSRHGTPTGLKSSGAPALPSPKRLEPLRF